MNIKKKMSNKSIRGVIWHDIARGFYADRFRYLIVVLMLAGVLIILGNHEFGMMDTIFFIQGGYDPVLIIKEGKIVFPFVWMLIQFLVPFMIYSYCNDDCEGVGIDFLMKCRSRRLWWNSKCLWNCLTVLSVYAIQYATAFVYGLCNGNLSMKINYELFEKISNKSVPDNAAKRVDYSVYACNAGCCFFGNSTGSDDNLHVYESDDWHARSYGMECYVSIYKQSADDRK